MSKVSIKGGGQVGTLKGKLTAIKFHAPDSNQSKSIYMVLESNSSDNKGLPFDNLSYLTIDEAMELSKALNEAIKDTINQYTK